MKEKFRKIFKNNFDLFALLHMLVSMALFIYMIIEIWPEIVEDFNYIFSVNVEATEILGIELIYHSKAIFYLFMFGFQCIYNIFGITVLFLKNNQRRVFKIMFREIFYVSGIITIHNIFAVFYFLFMPVQDVTSILSLFFMIFAIFVAVTGRLVSNYSVVSLKVNQRKNLGIFVISSFIVLCFVSFFGLDGEYNKETIIFYTLEAFAAIFGLVATIYFDDPDVTFFLTEPRKNKKETTLVDLNPEIVEFSKHQYYKNLDLIKATIPSSIKIIPYGTFSNCINLKEVFIPKSVETIEECAFFNCGKLVVVNYEGTKEEFNKIVCKRHWLSQAGTDVVYCTDGPVLIHD